MLCAGLSKAEETCYTDIVWKNSSVDHCDSISRMLTKPEHCHPIVPCRYCCCCRGCPHLCRDRRAHRGAGHESHGCRCLHRCLGCCDVVAAMLFIFMVLSFLMLLPEVDELLYYYGAVVLLLYCCLFLLLDFVIAAVIVPAAIIVVLPYCLSQVHSFGGARW